jgi:4-hydroxyphenylpyruvate dioxygenase
VIGGLHAPPDHREIVTSARRSGLRIESVNAIRDWALPDDPDCRDVAELLLEVAIEVGAPVIVCVAPIRADGMPPRDDVIASASERLAHLAELAAPTGVRLALEPVGLSSTRVGAIGGIRSLTDALAVVEAAGPTAGLAIDSYNVATAGVPFEEIARLPRERIAIAHAADGAVTGSPRALPGEGELPLGAFGAALAEAGFDGALSLEVLPEQPLPDPLDFARRGLDALRSLLPAAAT